MLGNLANSIFSSSSNLTDSVSLPLLSPLIHQYLNYFDGWSLGDLTALLGSGTVAATGTETGTGIRVTTKLAERSLLFKVAVACSALALFSYLALVRQRRFRGINELLKKYPDPTLPLRDLEVAREVYSRVVDYDFPSMMNLSLEMGALRTHAIPSISKVFLGSKQSQGVGHKRIEDVGLLLLEVTEVYSRRIARAMVDDQVDPKTGKVTSRWKSNNKSGGGGGVGGDDPIEIQEQANDEARATLAMDRINYMHSFFRIPQSDYLYNVGVFVVVPEDLIRRFEWRTLTELELNAIHAIWKDNGEKMLVKNIPETVQEMVEWTKNYEREHMKFATSNKIISENNLSIFQATNGAFIKNIFVSLMDPHLRVALGQEKPWALTIFLTESALWLRGRFIRHFMLPRSVPNVRTALRATQFETCDGGEQHLSVKAAEKSGVPKAARCPYSGGVRFVPRFNFFPTVYPRGYKIEELGPLKYLGRGPGTASGCPYAFAGRGSTFSTTTASPVE